MDWGWLLGQSRDCLRIFCQTCRSGEVQEFSSHLCTPEWHFDKVEKEQKCGIKYIGDYCSYTFHFLFKHSHDDLLCFRFFLLFILWPARLSWFCYTEIGLWVVSYKTIEPTVWSAFQSGLVLNMNQDLAHPLSNWAYTYPLSNWAYT